MTNCQKFKNRLTFWTNLPTQGFSDLISVDLLSVV